MQKTTKEHIIFRVPVTKDLTRKGGGMQESWHSLPTLINPVLIKDLSIRTEFSCPVTACFQNKYSNIEPKLSYRPKEINPQTVTTFESRSDRWVEAKKVDGKKVVALFLLTR